MTATARDRRDRLRAMLADLKMPGALEAVDHAFKTGRRPSDETPARAPAGETR